jgi:hypothetical protein
MRSDSLRQNLDDLIETAKSQLEDIVRELGSDNLEPRYRRSGRIVMISLIGSLQKLYYQAQFQTAGGPALAEQIQKLDDLKRLVNLGDVQKIPETAEKTNAHYSLGSKRRKR